MIVKTVDLPVKMSVSSWTEVRDIYMVFSTLVDKYGISVVPSTNVDQTMLGSISVQGMVEIDPNHMAGFVMTGVHEPNDHYLGHNEISTQEFLSAKFKKMPSTSRLIYSVSE